MLRSTRILPPFVLALMLLSIACSCGIYPANQQSSNPVLVGDLACFYHHTPNHKRYLTVLDTAQWRTVWRRKVRNGYDFGPWIADGKVFVTSLKPTIDSYDLMTGERIASVDIVDSRSRLIASRDCLFSFTYDAMPVHVYSHSLEPIGDFSPPAGIRFGMRWNDGALFVLSDRSIYSVFSENGRIVSRMLAEPIADSVSTEGKLLNVVECKGKLLLGYMNYVLMFDPVAGEFIEPVPAENLTVLDVASYGKHSRAADNILDWGYLIRYSNSPARYIKLGDVYCEYRGGVFSTDSFFVGLTSGRTRDGRVLWDNRILPYGAYDPVRNICIASLAVKDGALTVWNVATGEVIRRISHEDIERNRIRK